MNAGMGNSLHSWFWDHLGYLEMQNQSAQLYQIREMQIRHNQWHTH